MSESVTASTETPGVPESGPASGTTPEAAVSAVAPADFSSAPEVVVEAPAVAEVAAPEVKESILSQAEPAPKTEEPVAEKKAEEVKADEPKAEEPKAEEKKSVDLPAPVFEPFKLPEDVKLDDAKLGGFTGLLGEFENKITADPTQAHAAAQEFGQKLLDLYIGETEAAAQRHTEAVAANWSRTQDQWVSEFREDPEIGKNRAETSLTRMGGLMDMYGQSAGPERLSSLRSILTMTGAGNNVEVLRFVNWAASRLVERARPVAAPQARPPVVGSKATRLYRNSTSNGAA